MMHDIDFVEINRTALRQLASLLARWLPTGKRQGHEFVALNPTRADNKPGSFSINMNTGEWADFATGDKGGDPISLLAYLRGTKQGEAAKELAIELGINEHSKTNGRAHEYRPPPPEKPQPFFDGHLIKRGFELVKEYDYTDEDSELLYQTLRYEHPTEKKEFLARRPDGRGGWLSGAGERRVLYRGNDLQRAVHNTVFVCEGEKDADRLADLDFVAVTVAFGTWNEDSIKALKGKETLILEDNDVPGRKKAEDAAKALYGIAENVRIVALPGLAEGEDVSDWLDQGGDAYRLVDLAKQAPLWEPKQPAGNDSNATLLRWFGDEPLKRPPWLVQGVLPETGVALIAGQWGTGKTFVGVDLSTSVAVGTPFAGSEVCRVGGTLWLAAEGEAEVEVRVKAATERKRKDLGKGDISKLPFARQAFDVPSLKATDALPSLLKMAKEASRGMGRTV